MDEDEIRAMGWQTVSAYGYTHSTGWSIGQYRVNDDRTTILWGARQIHRRFASPLAALCTTPS